MPSADKRKGKSRVWVVPLLIIGVIIGVVLGAMIIAVVLTAPGRSELQNIAIAEVDFDRLQDGVYTGTYRGTKDSLRNAAVEVTVAAGAVTKIRVTEGSLVGDKQMRALSSGQSINHLFEQVIKAQSLQVDVISGATLTSNAHLKAIENALRQAEAR
jgi:uncharacterized protein with FMN-binding domain